MKKITKEYAEKLAEKYIDQNYVDWAKSDPATQNSKDAYREGYMKAIEENNVEELIEVLNSLQVRLNACMNVGDIDVTEAYDSFYQNIVSEALKKATKI